MKKGFCLVVAFLILFMSFSCAEGPAAGNVPPAFGGGPENGLPPQMPEGQPPEAPPEGMPGGTPPSGKLPEKPDGQMPGFPPEGMPGGMGGPGGTSAPTSWNAVYAFSEDTSLSNQEIISEGNDESALWVSGGQTALSGAAIRRESDSSSGGDSASFYGVGAAVLVTDGKLTLSDSEITTNADGGAGVFAYGSGIAYVDDCTITTERGTSGGIHVAGGGTLYANNLTVVTNGASSAAIRSDRGGGTMIVNGGSYTSNGSGSPSVYVTADITVNQAKLNATGSEALCLEGRNSVALNDCTLEGNMPDQSQNDNTWTVIVYQSMSGDSEIGKGSFSMNGGKLISHNGGIFYTTNTVSDFFLKNVEILSAADCEYLLRCTGNTNQRGWGRNGANGAECNFTCEEQELSGTILWDSISTLDLSLNSGSIYSGAILDDETCAGNGGSGSCSLTIDETSTWIVSGNSVMTSLTNKGRIMDTNGLSVTVQNPDGQILVQGDSAYIITVNDFITD